MEATDALRGRRNRTSLLVPLILPIILSLLPLLALREEHHQATKTLRELSQSRWEQKVNFCLQTIRSGLTLEGQMNSQSEAFKRLISESLRRRPESDLRLDALLVNRAFAKTFPPRKKANGQTYWSPQEQSSLSVFIPGAAQRLVPLSGPGLSSQGMRQIGVIMDNMLVFNTLPPPEKSRLDKLTRQVFGRFCPFEMLAQQRRGMLTPVHYLGKRSFVLWDYLKFNQKLLGTYLLILPADSEKNAHPLHEAVHQLARITAPEITPVLFPLESAPSSVRPLLPAILGSATPEIRKLAREVLSSIPRREIASFSLLTKTPGLWIHRDTLALEVPYEVWMVSMPPRVSSVTTAARTGFALGSLIIMGWLLLIFRILLTSHPLSPNLGPWLLSFFALIGAIPLSVLYFTGSFRISTEVQRRSEETIRQVHDTLEEFDSGSRLIFHRWVNSCRSMLQDQGWGEDLLSPNLQTREKANQELFRRLGSRQIDYVMVYPLGKSPFYLCLPQKRLGGPRGEYSPAQGGLQFLTPFAIRTAEYLEPHRRKEFEDALGETEKAMFTLYDTTVSQVTQKDFFMVRSTGDIIEIMGKRLFQFHDTLTKDGRQIAWFIFRTDAPSLQQFYLSQSIDKNHLSNPDQIYAYGRILPGGCELEKTNIRLGDLKIQRTFQRILNLAARTNSQQTQVIGNRVYLAHPSVQMPSFILGAVLNLQPILDQARNSRQNLIATTLALAIPILFLGWSVSQYFLFPLTRVKQALERVKEGDLDLRIDLVRDDELGEMTQAFNQMIHGLEKRRRLMPFVSGTLGQALAQRPEELAKGPSLRQGTVLVTDLRSFTTLSETFPARVVVSMLNEHLEAMSSVIQEQGGMIDKFIGDAIIAVFYDTPEQHSLQPAMTTARELIRQHRRIQEARRQQGDFAYRMGIGIDYGLLMVGTVHSRERDEQAILGEPRQNAETLEGTSRHGSYTRIVLSARALKDIQAFFPGLRFHPLSEGRGFELIDLEERPV